MTVKELICELLDMPMNAKVVTTHCLVGHEEHDVERVIAWPPGTKKPCHYSSNARVILYDVDDPY